MSNQAVTEEVELEQESYPVCCIESAVKSFLQHLQGLGRSASTVEGHGGALSKLCRFLDERGIAADRADVTALTPQLLADYQGWLYQARSRYGRPYGLMSQIVMLNSVQVFGKYLVASGLLLRNPAEALKLPKEPKRLPGTILTSKEVRRLLKQPDTATVLGFRDRTMYEVLYSTGLRISELIGMRVEHLVLPDSVPARAGAGEGSSLFVPETKHYKDRYVPLGATACRYLAGYLDQVRPSLVRRKSGDIVFLSRCNRMLDDGGVQQKLRIYARRAHIEKHLTVHVFRHTLATGMLRRGADLRQIQELLGHRQLTTTQLYTHIVRGELKRVQAHCHPREQVDLPDGFTVYRGRTFLTAAERGPSHPANPVDPVKK